MININWFPYLFRFLYRRKMTAMTISMTTIRNRAPNTAPMTKPASFPFSSMSPDMVTGFWVVVVMARDLFSHLWIKTSFSTSAEYRTLFTAAIHHVFIMKTVTDIEDVLKVRPKQTWRTQRTGTNALLIWRIVSFSLNFALWDCTRTRVWSDCYFSFGISIEVHRKFGIVFHWLTERKTTHNQWMRARGKQEFAKFA